MSVYLVRSLSKAVALVVEYSEVMMREVRLVFSRRRASYLVLSYAYCCFSCRCSLLSVVVEEESIWEVTTVDFYFHSRSWRDNRSISACRALRSSFLL